MSRPRKKAPLGLARWEVLYNDEGQLCRITVVAKDKADAIGELWCVRPGVGFVSAEKEASPARDALPANAENSSPLPAEGAQSEALSKEAPYMDELAPDRKALRAPRKSRTGVSVPVGG